MRHLQIVPIDNQHSEKVILDIQKSFTAQQSSFSSYPAFILFMEKNEKGIGVAKKYNMAI